jgi:hypothetical protein
MAAAEDTPMDRLLCFMEDRCGAAANMLEEYAETVLDRHGSEVERIALDATARELRTLERAAGAAQGYPERIPDLVRQFEMLWTGGSPKSLLDVAPR